MTRAAGGEQASAPVEQHRRGDDRDEVEERERRVEAAGEVDEQRLDDEIAGDLDDEVELARRDELADADVERASAPYVTPP